jgi:diguanylate cyclase (GGDEF)-like protein
MDETGSVHDGADTAQLPYELVGAGLRIVAREADTPELLNEILDLVSSSSGALGARVDIRGFGEVSVGELAHSRPVEGDRVVAREVELGGESIGSIMATIPPRSSPAEEETAALLVGFAADLVAAVWAHHEGLERERAGREEEQGLVRAGQALSRTLRLADVLPVILEELRSVVPYDTASVQELRDDRVVIIGGAGIDPDVFYGLGFDVEREGTPNADVIRRKQPVIVGDIFGEHPYYNFPSPDHAMSGVRGWMGVPLMFGDECVGMLTLDKYEPNFYTPRHARLAESFAAQAAIALENARAFERAQVEVRERREAEERLRLANKALHDRMKEVEALQEHLREQSVRDPLTGVFNRRYLIETLEQEIHRAQRSGAPLTVAVVDVDHFKSINDLLGHDAGDRVLTKVAQTLASNVRDEDVVCRYGGEEFVVVLPGTTLEVASERAARWQSELRSMILPDALEGRPITISVGLASAPAQDTSGEELVRLADEAMYVAKRRGRDRVERADT